MVTNNNPKWHRTVDDSEMHGGSDKTIFHGHYIQRPPSDDGDEDENDTIEEEDEGDEEGSQMEQSQDCYHHQCKSTSPGRSISQNRTRALRYRKAFMGKW